MPTAEQPLRLAEFEQLFRSAVTGLDRSSPTELQLTLSPEPEAAARAAHLAARETRCCSFFTFTLTLAAGGAQLAIEVPAGRVEVLDAVARLVAAGGRG